MSISGIWTAIRGKAPGDVLRELGLHVTELQDAAPALTGTQLSNGWYVITVDLRSGEDPCAPVLARLSSGCEVVTCGAVESTMYSEAAGWKDGVRTWSVTFNPEESDKLTVEGSPPSALDSILERQPQRASGARVDYAYFFDVAFHLSKSITGFRPDEGSPERYDVLTANGSPKTLTVSKKSSWLKKLFG